MSTTYQASKYRSFAFLPPSVYQILGVIVQSYRTSFSQTFGHYLLLKVP
jgi:hypothetical protein